MPTIFDIMKIAFAPEETRQVKKPTIPDKIQAERFHRNQLEETMNAIREKHRGQVTGEDAVTLARYQRQLADSDAALKRLGYGQQQQPIIKPTSATIKEKPLGLGVTGAVKDVLKPPSIGEREISGISPDITEQAITEQAIEPPKFPSLTVEPDTMSQVIFNDIFQNKEITDEQKQDIMQDKKQDQAQRSLYEVELDKIAQLEQSISAKYDKLEEKEEQIRQREPKFGENFAMFMLLSLLGGTNLATQWWGMKQSNWKKLLDRVGQDKATVQKQLTSAVKERMPIVTKAIGEEGRLALEREKQKNKMIYKLQEQDALARYRSAQLELSQRRLDEAERANQQREKRQAQNDYNHAIALQAKQELEDDRYALSIIQTLEKRQRHVENAIIRLANSIAVIKANPMVTDTSIVASLEAELSNMYEQRKIIERATSKEEKSLPAPPK